MDCFLNWGPPRKFYKELHVKRLTRLALGIVIVGASTGSWADGAGAPNTGAVTAVEADANVKPRFDGFTFDLTTADGSGLNSIGHNYRNDFVWYFEPAWNIGQMYFRGTRWKTLQLQARFSLTANVSGTDEANFKQSYHGRLAMVQSLAFCWGGIWKFAVTTVSREEESLLRPYGP